MKTIFMVLKTHFPHPSLKIMFTLIRCFGLGFRLLFANFGEKICKCTVSNKIKINCLLMFLPFWADAKLIPPEKYTPLRFLIFNATIHYEWN